jgi:anti-sigma factor RsiW
MAVPNAACDRARAWVGRELDGELNEICRIALRRHLGRCAECAQYAVDVEWFTSLLREAALEPYRCDPGIPHRRRPSRVLRLVPSIAALTLVMTVTTTALTLELGRSRGGLPQPPTDSVRTVTTSSPQSSEGLHVLGLQPIKLPIGQRSAVEDF